MSQGKGTSTTTTQRHVAIFGAGISGLTAAHELIERGYKVEVYETEPPSVVDQRFLGNCAIGGIARTQWARIPTTGGTPKAATPATLHLGDLVPFGKNDKLTPEGRKVLHEVARALVKHSEVTVIEVRGYDEAKLLPDPDQPAKTVKRKDYKRAVTVSKHLKGNPKLKHITFTPVAMGLGHRDDWTQDDKDRNYVAFRIVEDLVPGDHGYRFFPSFYRNLFDTMRRTPVADDGAIYIETPRTVLDNIVPTTFQAVARLPGNKPFEFARRPPESLQELFDVLQATMESMGFTLADIQKWQVKTFQYMTSCPERRAAAYELLSWWDFMDGDHFSKAFQHFLDATPEALVAMRSTTTDARTFGNVTMQMVLDQYKKRTPTDGTLNGPTSLAWFAHWRRYLEHQGVEFFQGTLERFELIDGYLWPVIKAGEYQRQLDSSTPQESVLVRDYYVVAVPVFEARRIVKDFAKAHSGIPEVQKGDLKRILDLPLGDPGKAHPGGMIAHMSGVQFYLPSDLNLVEGHSYYADSPWGLSSIAQPQFWTRRRGWWDGYRGVLTVDVCIWDANGTITTKSPAWACRRGEFAKEVWTQMRRTFGKSKFVPKPLAYHVDEFIERADPNGAGPPIYNHAPFITNPTGHYSQRPGRLGPDGYDVHFGSLVFAGPFMQTHTRITTMEAANESARHAVNGILGADAFRGARCAIHNPEEHELLDLKPFLELDRRLHELGLPHFIEILELRRVPTDLLRPYPDLRALTANALAAVRTAEMEGGHR